MLVEPSGRSYQTGNSKLLQEALSAHHNDTLLFVYHDTKCVFDVAVVVLGADSLRSNEPPFQIRSTILNLLLSSLATCNLSTGYWLGSLAIAS